MNDPRKQIIQNESGDTTTDLLSTGSAAQAEDFGHEHNDENSNVHLSPTGNIPSVCGGSLQVGNEDETKRK